MMNDDEKKSIVNDQSEAQPKEEKDDAKLADVIDLDKAREKKSEEDAPKQVTLDEAVSALKETFAELKAQFIPIKKTFTDMVDAAKSGADSAKEKLGLEEGKKAEDGESKAEEAPKRKDVVGDTEKALTPDAEAVKETSEVINLALERLKRRGIEKKINLKDVLEKQFTKFADKNLKEGEYTVDEEGKRVVKVDAKFLQDHGNEAIPEVLGGVARSFVNTLFGDILGLKSSDQDEADDEDSTAGENKADDEEVKAEDDAKSEEAKYRVQFDFAKLIGDAIKTVNLTDAPAEHTPEEEAQARETAAKGVQIIEDVLNGIDPEERLKAEEAQEAEEASSDEISPVDEKHQRILELAKEYDQAMKGDDDDK